MLVGWSNYFCLGPVSRAYVAMDHHATNRLLLIALCVWLCLLIGRHVERAGLRHLFDPHRKRRLSLFRLGRLYLQRFAANPTTTQPHFIL